MTGSEPLTAILDMLAACREQLTQLDVREAGHHATATGRLAEIGSDLTVLGQMLQDHEAALAQLTGAASDGSAPDADGYSPNPPPAWWKLPPDGRQEPLARLRTWVEQVYRPGYGHLAAALGPCWASHDLCLYGLDILSELWSVLYLQPRRSPGLLSAQAEYQVRILPALASQLQTETARCGHPRGTGPVTGQRRSTP
jgi:hypothetical protein